MERYVNQQTGREVLRLSNGFNDISALLRDEDRRPVRNLFQFLLLTEGAPKLYLGGSAASIELPREYGDIDLLAVYDSPKNRKDTIERINAKIGSVPLTSDDTRLSRIELGKSLYLITVIAHSREYLDMNIDESLLLEPSWRSPTMGIVPVGAPIELCLGSIQKFERDYRKK